VHIVYVFDICLLDNKCVTPVYMCKTSLLGTFVLTAIEGKWRQQKITVGLHYFLLFASIPSSKELLL